ncbi:hypothetical protein AB0L54_33120 [Streptomyces sp. NPDC052196]|uniref:hypothetical protein n=1 Tax=Streptomyces sp. NPDC052196 TaxID=3156691 RepID=UPI0034340522
MSKEPEWWSVRPASEPGSFESPYEARERWRDDDADALMGAADAMRDAADAMRDATTPPAESNWDFSWIGRWFKENNNGRACKVALTTTGPVYAFLLFWGKFEFGRAAGMTLIGIVLGGIWHLRTERKITRTIVWGFPVGLAYYTPVAIVLGTAKILVGG